MKTKSIIIVIIVVAVILSSCQKKNTTIGDPPIGNKTITSLDKYMKINKYVKNLMDAEPQNIFPDNLPTDANANYYYYYNCALLGYPNCVVFLSLTYDNYDSYCEEIERINTFEEQDTITIGNNDYIIFNQIYRLSLDYYFDEEDMTGMYNKFVIILKNEEELRLEFLFAVIREEAVKPEEVIHIAKPLYETGYGLPKNDKPFLGREESEID